MESDGTEPVDELKDNPISADTDWLDLPSGKDLTTESADSITTDAPTKLIVLAGSAGTGKTTLFASIYECFQKGPFGGYLFAGSSTLPGLERRCHLTRIASDGSQPDTERTIPSFPHTLLHLKVRRHDLSRPPQSILITDLAGEAFRLARDFTEEAKKLHVVARANRFVMLVDGAKLSAMTQRHQALADSRSILRSFLDAGMLTKRSRVDVLITKWDLIEASDHTDKRIRDHVNWVQSSLTDQFQSRLQSIRIVNVAARPVTPILPFAYNLDVLFSGWLEDDPHEPLSIYKPSDLANLREFDRFLSRFPSDWLS